MKTIRIFSTILVALAIFAVAASGQRRPVKKPTPKPRPTPISSFKTTLELRLAKDKVDVQLFNLNKFLPVYDNAIAVIEANEKGIATNDQRIDRARLVGLKQKLAGPITNLKPGLSALENDFVTKPVLNRFAPKIKGIADLISQAERFASEGRLNESRAQLRIIAQKLRDTHTAIP